MPGAIASIASIPRMGGLGLSRGGSILSRAVFATKAKGSAGVLTDIGTGAHAIQHGSGAGADSNDPLWLPLGTGQYLYLPAVSGNYASAPDSAALRITGDIDIQVLAAADDWTPSGRGHFLGKYGTANQLGYRFTLNTDGTLRLSISTDGTSGTSVNADSSVAVGATDGTSKWVRATRRQSDGRVQFFTSSDGSNWTQLGTDKTLASGTAIFGGTSALEIGSTSVGTAELLAGKFYRAQIYNGIGGTLVFDADFSDPAVVAEPYATFAEKSTNAATVTISRSASGRKAAIVDRDMYQFATDDLLEIADAADLNFALTDSFTVVLVTRRYGNAATSQAYIAKKVSTLTTDAGYCIFCNGSAISLQGRVADGAAGTNSASINATTGVLDLAALIRDVGADRVNLAVGSTLGTPQTDNTTAPLSNAEVLRIGRFSGAGTSYGEFEFLGAAVFRWALSTAELAQVKAELLA